MELNKPKSGVPIKHLSFNQTISIYWMGNTLFDLHYSSYHI